MTGANEGGPKAFFEGDHRRCDALWSEVERGVDAGEGEAEAWTAFADAMERHFRMEEEVLFPRLEERTGMPPGAGPTAVMRAEHTQMRGLIAEMDRVAQRADWEELADHGDTLLMLTQQHNVKEEGILYPMADQVLGGAWASLWAALAPYRGEG